MCETTVLPYLGSNCRRRIFTPYEAFVVGTIIVLGAFIVGAILVGSIVAGAIITGAIVGGVLIAGAIVVGVNFAGAFVGLPNFEGKRPPLFYPIKGGPPLHHNNALQSVYLTFY